MNRSGAACGLMHRTHHAQGEYSLFIHAIHVLAYICGVAKPIKNERSRTIIIKGLAVDLVNE
jgi:hypothetical protein